MKLSSLFSPLAFLCPAFARLALLALPFALSAQPAEPPADAAKTEVPLVELTETPAVVSRTAHSREWAWVERVVDETGNTNELAHGFTEIAGGACWWDGVQYQDTVPAFTAAKGGAGFVVERAATQVAVAADISVPGSVTIVTPEGRTLRSSPAMVVFTDRRSGESIRVAEVKSSQGELIEPNVVLWRDAVVDLAGRPLGDYRVVFTAAAVEADVVWRKRLPDSAAFGMAAETTDVSVYTEFFGTEPTAVVAREVTATGAEPARPDAQIWFGGSSMMDSGKAYGLDEAGARTGAEISVRKEWGTFEGDRRFLLEQASFTELQPLLAALPEASAPSPEQRARLEKLQRTAKLTLPARRGAAPVWARDGRGRLTAEVTADKDVRAPRGADGLVRAVAGSADFPVRTAAAGKSQSLLTSAATGRSGGRGVVWDYTLLATTPSLTLGSLTTSYCSGAVNVSTNFVAQAGTVVKFAATNSPSLNILSTVTNFAWQGAPYRPISLLSKDDNGSGEILPGSTGSPSGYYATTALSLNNLGVLTLTNLCIRNANVAIAAIGTSRPAVRHAQFVNCGTGVKVDFNTTLQNALFHQVENVVWTTGIYGSTGEHITVDAALYLNYRASTNNGAWSLTNSLVAANVTNTSGVTFTATLVAQPFHGTLFATAGAGAHYLNISNGWLGGQSLVNVAEPLASELARMSVIPPTVVTSPVSADQRWTASALGYDSALFEGYRYWPIHFLAAGLTVTNATLTLTNAVLDNMPNGAVLGFWGANTIGVTLQSGGKFVSQGRPDALNRLCYASAVQEQATAGPSGSVRALFKLTNSPATRPDLNLRFTRAEFQADTAARRTLVDDGGYFLGSLTLRDNRCSARSCCSAPSARPARRRPSASPTTSSTPAT